MMGYYSAIKKNTFDSSNEVDETGVDYTEWSKPERKTPIQYTNTYIWNLERSFYARQQKRHMYPNVHHSTVYNSQDMEAT